MKKFYFLILFALIASAATFADAAEKTVTYTFTSKSWEATNDSGDAANWTSGADGSQFDNSKKGIAVQKADDGANATSPDSFNNISNIVVTYSTSSKGVGSIAIYTVVDDTENLIADQTVSKSQSNQTFTYTPSASSNSGKVKIAVPCTTSTIYIHSVAITYDDGITRSEAPEFSLEEGTYTSAQTITLTSKTEGAKVYYKINNDTDYTTYSAPIQLTEEGTYAITAYTGETDTTEQSLEVTNIYVLNFPLAEPYKLCTNKAYITDGAKIIFVGDPLGFGMAGYNSDGYMDKAEVTIVEDELTHKTNDIKVFTIGVSASGMTFCTDGNYLQGYTSSNKLRYKTEPDEACYWTISSIDSSTGKADVTMKSNSDRYLRYNTSAPRFATYGSKTGELYIYLLESTSSVSKVAASEGVKVIGAEGSVVVSADKATDVMVYTIAGQLVSKSTVAAGTSTVSVAPGFYVVRAASTAAKVVVK